MDKKVLRSVLADLNENDVLVVNFRQAVDAQSGEYTVKSKRRGRGKGGSVLVDLQLVGGSEDTPVVTVGTPTNQDLLSLVVNGQLHGHENENDVPLFFAPNAEASVSLKDSFKAFLKEEAWGKKVEVQSDEPTLNGTFTVKKAVQKRGRPGQIALLTEEGPELWSYRHSGAIQSFKVLD